MAKTSKRDRLSKNSVRELEEAVAQSNVAVLSRVVRAASAVLGSSHVAVC